MLYTRRRYTSFLYNILFALLATHQLFLPARNNGRDAEAHTPQLGRTVINNWCRGVIVVVVVRFLPTSK